MIEGARSAHPRPVISVGYKSVSTCSTRSKYNTRLMTSRPSRVFEFCLTRDVLFVTHGQKDGRTELTLTPYQPLRNSLIKQKNLYKVLTPSTRMCTSCKRASRLSGYYILVLGVGASGRKLVSDV